MQKQDVQDTSALASDLIFGADKIATTLGLTRRQIYHSAASGHLPTFRIGATICARRSTLLAWFDQQEKGHLSINDHVAEAPDA
jgi:hypothetical protein